MIPIPANSYGVRAELLQSIDSAYPRNAHQPAKI
jgi:hypothetical protein